MENIDLRDYFAAKALPAYQALHHSNGDVLSHWESAEMAYAQADAMMLERIMSQDRKRGK